MLQLLFVAVTAPSPRFQLPSLSSSSLDEVWHSPLPYIVLITLLIVLITVLSLHLLSSDPSPTALLHKYKYRHDGYLPLSPCSLPPSSSFSSFTSPSSSRTLRVLTLPPLPRPGNALPSPLHPRAILLWLPSLHSNVTHSVALLHAVSSVGNLAMGLDWRGEVVEWRWEGVVEEVKEWVKGVRKQYDDVPVFIGGEEFGASLALATAIQQPDCFAGLVLLAPAIKLTLHPLKLLTIQAKVRQAHRGRREEWSSDEHDEDRTNSACVWCLLCRRCLPPPLSLIPRGQRTSSIETSTSHNVSRHLHPHPIPSTVVIMPLH